MQGTSKPFVTFWDDKKCLIRCTLELLGIFFTPSMDAKEVLRVDFLILFLLFDFLVLFLLFWSRKTFDYSNLNQRKSFDWRWRRFSLTVSIYCIRKPSKEFFWCCCCFYWSSCLTSFCRTKNVWWEENVRIIWICTFCTGIQRSRAFLRRYHVGQISVKIMHIQILFCL